MDPAEYVVDADSFPGAFYCAYGKTYPPTQNIYNAVTVRFVAGYANAGAVPQRIKQAMFLLIGHWYENRENSVVGTIVNKLPDAVDALLQSARLLELQ